MQAGFWCHWLLAALTLPDPAVQEYDILVKEDTHAPRHRLWFHFNMAGGVAGQCSPAWAAPHCDTLPDFDWHDLDQSLSFSNMYCQGQASSAASTKACSCTEQHAWCRAKQQHASAVPVPFFFKHKESCHYGAALGPMPSMPGWPGTMAQTAAAPTCSTAATATPISASFFAAAGSMMCMNPTSMSLRPPGQVC